MGKEEESKDTHDLLDLLERYATSREYQTQQGFSLSCTFGMQVPLPRTNIHPFRWWWGRNLIQRGRHSLTHHMSHLCDQGISSLLSVELRTSVILFQFPLSSFLYGWMEDTKVECDKQTIHENGFPIDLFNWNEPCWWICLLHSPSILSCVTMDSFSLISCWMFDLSRILCDQYQDAWSLSVSLWSIGKACLFLSFVAPFCPPFAQLYHGTYCTYWNGDATQGNEKGNKEGR